MQKRFLAKNEKFEFHRVITIYNKSLQYISKYMRFQNFLAALLTLFTTPYHSYKGKLFMNAA